MTTFRNVHIQPIEAAAPDALPRLRFVTNDPAREYEQRPGTVEKLADSVAALILSKQGFSKVGRNGVSIDLDGKRLTYWSETSITIATKAGTNEKVLWTVNRHQPDVLHILSGDGEYIETIPLDGKVPWFDEHATKRELGAKRRVQERSMQRVRMLHAPDSQAEIDRVDQNNAQIAGLVQTFPTQRNNGDRSRTKAERITPREAHIVRGADREISFKGHRSNGQRLHDRANKSELPTRAAEESRMPRGDSFSAADRIHQVQRTVDRQRAAHAVAERAEAERIAAVTEEDLDALTGDDFERTEAAAITATENQSDEDLSDLIL